MIILGIDPGTSRLGFAVLDKQRASLTVLDYGCFQPPKDIKREERLFLIQGKIRELNKKNPAQSLAIEKLFVFKNQKTVMSVSEARGAILSAAAEEGLPVFEYTPLQVKQAVAGYGRADKQQIQKMVKIILKMDVLPQPDDAADALAVAICHAGFVRE